ncbi:hypothetical protein ASU31_10505 [Pedobacter ginsenosidimutans]|uniref:RNA polymerase sigma factor 70 region 4 type 2 domain-containing protein n=1 Tax=Pedobacter ginsenosidimutans TaxID=687842 RepID=A0A0T5VQ45_9SPHI|nr:sigma-70 family RNA polymerase sigma factor [Pedobacter ginsenosidimutans]KRT15933.1 hypothetical protein ASU31_10505 [Pedobacter ginsenosidimutans]
MKRGTDLKIEWNSFISDGTEAAYYQLYSHYHKYFFYLGIKKGALSPRIADCVNDLFLYIFENREKLTNIRDHHNYLVTLFLRFLFKKQKFSAEESQEIEILEESQIEPPIDERFMIKDTNEHVKQVLQQYIDELSVSQARMIYEKFYLNLSYEEIAAANEISVRTAYNLTFRAINNLRKYIGDHKVASLIAAITTLSLIYFFVRF